MNITSRIKEVLIENPDTRNNDNVLMYELMKLSDEYKNNPITFEEFCHFTPEYLYNFYGCPRMGSIERARRDLFRKRPELEPDDEITTRATRENPRIKSLLFVNVNTYKCI